MEYEIGESQDAELPLPADPAKSLHEGIVVRLRRYIIEDNLPEGARIPERQLCETMGVSRTPMREALKVLAAEGLVELLPNRGARVRRYTDSDVQDLFELMGGLEALSGRLACIHATDDEIEAIENLHLSMYSAYVRRDLPAYFDLNQRIHRTIVASTRNKALQEAYAIYSARLQRMRFTANREVHKDRWGEAMREHEEILDALRRRAGSELSDIMFKHLMNKSVAVRRVREELEVADQREVG